VILSAQSLSKRYGAAPGYAAVRDANLELRPGEFVSIVGRSGSGKSTLMAMLGALTQPTRGKVMVDGADIWTLPESELARFRARHIGFVFQFPSLLSNLTAVDNVALPALLGRTMPAEKAYAHGYDLLARVGLADRADAYPGALSGGEQRRVAIARALINSPALLLADEPTSDLDEDTEADIIDLPTCSAGTHSASCSSRTICASPNARSALTKCGKAPSSQPPRRAWPAQRSESDASVRPRLIRRRQCPRRGSRACGSAAICGAACRSFLSPQRSFSPAPWRPI
jgi:ABC-type lipoprotein export system ATPase subunit